MPEIMANKKGLMKKNAYLLFIFAAFLLLLLFSPQVMGGVRHALQLCYKTIIPSLFPFMLLSDLLCASFLGQTAILSRLDGVCRKLFAVPAIGMLAFLAGALCGFPLGVKVCADLFRVGRLRVEEAERLLAFCNNTGPAFVITGVGIGLLNDVKMGVLLYALQIVSGLAVGILLARLLPTRQCEAARPCAVPPASQPGIVPAVQRSMRAMIFVCGMIVTFSIPIALMGVFVKNSVLLAFISSFLEMGNASAAAAALYTTAPDAALLALTNALCFGGLSVHLQAALFLSDLPISLRHHTAGKLLQSALACACILLLRRFL